MPVWVNGKPKPEGTRLGPRSFLWNPAHAEAARFGAMRRCPNTACRDSFTPAERCRGCGSATVSITENGSGPRDAT